MTSRSGLRAALRAALGLALAGSLATQVPAAAEPPGPARPEGSSAPGTGGAAEPPADPEKVLRRAGRILEGGAAGRRSSRADATLALRDVFLARPTMDFFDGLLADGLLARPTDGRADRSGDGYRVASRRRCGDRVCVHSAVEGRDAPESARWVRRTLRVVENVWDREVGKLGFRPPPPDGARGGDDRFDVYLVDVGERGLFGYCTPERRVAGERSVASGYCVLDDDFARDQYGARPGSSLRVTAAHEFFHAIQFGYDFREDRWLLESTATWVEERFADGADDNRRYLRYGSVRRPGTPLDRSAPDSYAHYGTWAFWELLAARHGDSVVRDVWRRADARRGARDEYSVQALDRVLADNGGVRRALTSYALANLAPRRGYAEGAAWPAARVDEADAPGGGRQGATTGLRIDHLAARHLVIRPRSDRRGTRLLVEVDGPRARSAPAAVAVVRLRDGRWVRERIPLDRRGAGTVTVRFAASRVRSVVVTLVNGSTRYRCDEGTEHACAGKPLDDGRLFRVTSRVLRG